MTSVGALSHWHAYIHWNGGVQRRSSSVPICRVLREQPTIGYEPGWRALVSDERSRVRLTKQAAFVTGGGSLVGSAMACHSMADAHAWPTTSPGLVARVPCGQRELYGNESRPAE